MLWMPKMGPQNGGRYRQVIAIQRWFNSGLTVCFLLSPPIFQYYYCFFHILILKCELFWGSLSMLYNEVKLEVFNADFANLRHQSFQVNATSKIKANIMNICNCDVTAFQILEWGAKISLLLFENFSFLDGVNFDFDIFPTTFCCSK